MSNSALVSYTCLSPNYSVRTHAIDTITIHCMAAPLSVESCGAGFAKASRKASSNYGIGPDGRIGLYVEEKHRSWCSNSKSNDNRAVTIEVACERTHPYRVTNAAYAALILLVTDICRRNGIKQMKWRGDKSLVGQVALQNMTVHRWFAAKACPGDYLYNLHGDIAAKVNAKLGVAQAPGKTAAVTTGKVRVTADVLNIRTGPGTRYSVSGQIRGKGVYTITATQDGWGRLKSGAGWISLKYTEKV